MDLITIVTITYEDSAGLVRTKDSLPKSGFQWIVIDGSRDREILKLNQEILSDKNVLLVQEIDTGLFDAMNKGIKNAGGEIICFLNSGDVFSSADILSRVSNSYRNHGWDWAVGETKAVDQVANVLWSWPMPVHNSLKFRLGINSYCHQATFVRKSLIEEMGGFDTDSFYSDWILSLQLSRVSPPFKLRFDTTLFLVGGVSSQKTIEYWRKESCRLRKKHRVLIFNSRLLDYSLQYLAAIFISSTRGQLIRPDLAKVYP